MSQTDIATKQDVEEIVGRVVGGITSDMMQMISERFNEQGIVNAETAASLSRIENKLDATVNQVEGQEVRIKQLEVKAA